MGGGTYRQEPVQFSGCVKVGFHRRPSDALWRAICRGMDIIWCLLFVQLRDPWGSWLGTRCKGNGWRTTVRSSLRSHCGAVCTGRQRMLVLATAGL